MGDTPAAEAAFDAKPIGEGIPAAEVAFETNPPKGPFFAPAYVYADAS